MTDLSTKKSSAARKVANLLFPCTRSLACLLAIIAFFGIASTNAHAAQATTFTGTLLEDNTFDPPFLPLPYTNVYYASDVTNTYGDNYAYFTRTLRPSVSGLYTIETTSSSFGATPEDPMTLLYDGTFDPNLPLQNFYVGNDDQEINLQSLMPDVLLQANHDYVLVITSSSPLDSGSISLRLSGPGAIAVNTNEFSSDTLSNAAPTDISLSSNSISHGAGLNASVGTLSTTDSDTNDSSFTYSLIAGQGSTDNASFGISGQNLTVNNPSTMSPGSYSVRVQTADGHGGVFEKVFSIQIVENPPTVVSTISGQSATYGMPFLFTFGAGTFNDPDNDVLTFTAANLPPGIVFDPTNRAFFGTPTLAGTYTVSVIASDGQSPPLFATNSFQFSVAKAVLTVTANNTSRIYGAANPSFSVSYSGFVNSDDAGDIDILPTASSPASNNSPVGSYAIIPSGGSDANYNFAYANGTLSVTKATLVATAQDQSRVYGDANPALGISYSGFVNGDDATVIDVPPTAATTANASSPVGTYAITLSGGSDNNYDLTLVNGALTVTKASIVATANPQTKVYGAANPTLSISYSGFANGEDSTVLDSLPIASTSADATSAVGTYPITLSGGSDNNYNINLANGILTVTPATLVASANSQERAYGQTNEVLGASYSGFVNGDSSSVISGQPLLSTLAETNSPVGSYEITLALGTLSAANYNFQLVNGSLTVTQAVLLITADNQSRLYGTTNPVLTATMTGFVNGEDSNVVTGAAALSTTADLTSAIGTYDIVAELGTLAATNYSFSFSNGVLTVGKALLTVTADNQNRLYGAANSALSYTVTGFVDGENNSVLTGTPSISTSADANSSVGSYPITITQGSLAANNYAFNFIDGTLSIGKAPLTITANGQTRIYGQPNSDFTLSYSGFVNSEDASVIDSLPTAASTADATSSVGSYAITLSGGTDNNYDLTLVNGTLSVTKATLVATAQDQTRIYGDANPALGISYSGFVNGDDATVIDVPPTAATAANASSPVGPYAITLSGGSDNNYDFTLVNGTLTVTKASIVATANPQTKVYGAANPTLSISYSGFANGEDSTVLDSLPIASTSADATSAVGTYPITLSGGSDNNYNINLANGILTVTPATLVASANSQERAYGQTNEVLGASYSGFVNGDSSSVISGQPLLSTLAETNSPVGSYEITLALGTLSAANYNFQLVNGSLTVTQAVLLVTADNQSRLYGTTNPVLTATMTGFVNGEDSTVVSGAAALSTTADLTSAIGTYDIVAELGTLAATNYSFSFSNGVLTVGKALLTVTADNQTRLYGAANSTLNYTVAGFVDGENNSVLTGTPSISTSADANSSVGSYPITITQGSLAANNYAFNFINGTLSIGKAPLTITANDQTRLYGQPNLDFTLSYSGFVNSEDASVIDSLPTAASTADATSSVGTYAITLSGGTDNNYELTLVNGTLSVTKATLVATAQDQTRIYGDANPVPVISYSGFANGEDSSVIDVQPTAATVTDNLTPVGTYPITLSGGSDNNYDLTLVNGTLTVTKASIGATANPQTKVYGAANPTLSISYSGFANGEDSAVLDSLPVASTSADATSAVGTYPITLSGGSANNYNINLANGILTVTPATLVASANSQERAYGQTNEVLGASYSGFVNGDSSSVISGQPLLSTLAETNSPVGSYEITLALGTLSAANYNFQLVNGSLTVTQAVLLVTADNQSRLYGTTNPVLTATMTGFVNGEDSNVITGAAALSTTADLTSAIGTYDIVAELGTLAATNYSFSFSNGVLTVGKALLTVTADNQNRLYGAANSTLSYTVTGFVDGENNSVLTGTPSISTSADANSSVGSYPITITQGSLAANNYAFNFIDGTLSIGKAPLTITANDQTRIYGQPNSDFTLSYSGFVNSEDASVIDSLPTAATAADATSSVGTYAITLSGGTDNNYDLTLVNGTLSVTKATLVATAQDQTRIYGDANPALGISYSGFVNGDDATVIDVPPTAATAANASSPVGPYAITLSGGSDNNYDLTLVNGTLTVTKASIVATANPQTKIYGAANPTLSINYSGFANGEDSTVLDSLPVASTSADATSAVGTYPITLSGGSANNYNINLANGILTVSPATLVASANSQERAYGQTNEVLGASYSGFVNGDSSSVISGQPLLSTLAETNSPIGSYEITLALGTLSAANYNFQLVNGSLTVTQAVLLVTADNQSRLYGTTNPVLTATMTGFVNGEDSSIVSGAAGLSTTADLTSAIGTYDIVAELGTLAATNYSFSFSNGVLTVGKALLTVTADNQNRLYGAANSTLSYNVTGFVDGENNSVLTGTPSISTSADANSSVGSYPITITQGSLAANNYAFNFINSTLSIGKAPLTITANDQTRVYGQPNSDFTLSYSGFVNSEDASVIDSLPTAASTADATSSVGSYAITLSGGTDNNYDLTLVNGALSVTKATLVATAQDQTRIYGDANPALSISYSGFVNGDDATVIDVPPTAGTAANASSPVGTYAITLSGGSDNNYDLTLVNGALTVTKQPLTVTANNATRIFGVANPTFTGTIEGLKNGDLITANYSSTALISSPAGTYPIIASIVDPSGLASNYAINLIDAVLTITSDDPPVVTLSTAPGLYTLGSNPIIIDSAAAITDGGSLDFNGGTLVVSIILNASANDQLAIQAQGTGANQIGIQGSTVTWGNVPFGTFAGGNALQPLTFTFNAAANPVNVTALARQLTFATTDSATGSRALQFVMSDGDGGISLPALRSLQINRLPIANDDKIEIVANRAITLAFDRLLQNDTDADNDTLVVGAVSGVSANGGRVTSTGTSLTYRPPDGFTGHDLLAYLVQDGRGGEDVGILSINVLPDQILKLTIDTDHSAILKMGGTPNQNYQIQFSTNLSDWSVLTGITADEFGVFQVRDADAIGADTRFYRALSQ